MAMTRGNQVSLFHSNQAGAPVINGQAGSLIDVLDACLVNGWGAQTATSLSVSGTTATLTLPGTPAMIPFGLVDIAGATLTGFVNGEYKVETVVGNVVTFKVAGVTPGSASGTITAKVASMGWAKVFSATNKAVYKSGSPAATGLFLRVVDDATDWSMARVQAFENMTDVDTGTGEYPTGVQVAAHLNWGKSSTNNSTAKRWHLVADDRIFYYLNSGYGTNDYSTYPISGSTSHAFGDIDPANTSDDSFSGVIIGFDGSGYSIGYTTDASDASQANISIASGAQAGKYMPRRYHEIGGSVNVTCLQKGVISNTPNSGTGSNFAFPNPANNGLILSRIAIAEYSPNVVRGELPGIFFSPQNILNPTIFNSRDIVVGTGALEGRKLMALYTGCAGSNAPSSCEMAFFDVTGPWRA